MARRDLLTAGLAVVVALWLGYDYGTTQALRDIEADSRAELVAAIDIGVKLGCTRYHDSARQWVAGLEQALGGYIRSQIDRYGPLPSVAECATPPGP